MSNVRRWKRDAAWPYIRAQKTSFHACKTDRCLLCNLHFDIITIMVTSIEIVDTAIKIGLGALISGFGAYLVAKLNHNKDAEKARIQRRRELLEAVAEQVELFTQAYLKHWAFITNWLTFEPLGKPITEESEKDFRSIGEELNNSFKDLISAESKLLLLGETKCQRLLREYGESAKVYRDTALVDRRTLTKEFLKEYRKEFLDKRETFFSELSNVYRRAV
jgi:hypothetical protein